MEHEKECTLSYLVIASVSILSATGRHNCLAFLVHFHYMNEFLCTSWKVPAQQPLFSSLNVLCKLPELNNPNCVSFCQASKSSRISTCFLQLFCYLFFHFCSLILQYFFNQFLLLNSHCSNNWYGSSFPEWLLTAKDIFYLVSVINSFIT